MVDVPEVVADQQLAVQEQKNVKRAQFVDRVERLDFDQVARHHDRFHGPGGDLEAGALSLTDRMPSYPSVKKVTPEK